jgi:acyl carrier protein
MTKSEVFKQVRKIVTEKFNLEEEEVQLTSTFVEDIGADSLDLVDLIMALEDEFGVKIDEEDTEKIKDKMGGSAEEEDITDEDSGEDDTEDQSEDDVES